jgi:hypothetical protein
MDLPPDPVAPLSLREVPPVDGVPGKRGRTVNAALATVFDGLGSVLVSLLETNLEAPPRELTAGGLRAGWVGADDRGLTFHRMVYVPGVTVSGPMTLTRDGFTARLRIAGPAAARGTLRIAQSGAIAGRLGGRRVRVRPPRAMAAAARLRALRGRRPAAWFTRRPSPSSAWSAPAG